MHRLFASTFVTVALLLSPAANAQSIAQNTTTQSAANTENVSLMVGDIFEILPTSSIQNPSYSWILTQNRNFLQAGRGQTFRYRFVQPGTYSLIAEIDSADMSQRITRTFTINAQARPLGQVQTGIQSASASGGSMTGGSGANLVGTNPPINQKNVVVLGDNEQLVELMPVNQDIKPLALDLNTNIDSNGDGNPANDVDDQDTFFQNYATPLYVWFASPLTTQTMSVTAVQNGGAVVQNITVVSMDYAQQNGLVVSPVTINTSQTSNTTYSFSPQFTSTQAPQSTLLYHWDFGDGQQSLLMNPTHTFAQGGTYDVHLQVSDIANGSQIASADTQVVIATATSTGSGTVAQTSSAAASAPATTTQSGGLFSSLGSLIWLVVIFVIFVVLGLLVVFLVSRMRRRPLDQTFEELEKNIVGGSPANEKKAPEPLAIATPQRKPVPTEADVVKREEESASAPKPAQTPRIDEAAAPSWLRKGLATQSSVPATQDTKPAATSPQSTPAPVRSPEPPKPTPAPKAQVPQPTTTKTTPAAQPAPKPQQTPTPAADTAPLPSWLQQTQGAAPAPSPKTQTPPDGASAAPAVTATPKPSVPPMPVTPKPAPAPARNPSPVPSPAVQSAQPSNPQTKQTSPSPAPQPPKQEQPKPTPKPADPFNPDLNPNVRQSPPMTVEPKPVPAAAVTQTAESPKPPSDSAESKSQTTAPATKESRSNPTEVIPPPPMPKEAAPAPSKPDANIGDAPIAFIRADSIEEQTKEEKKDDDQKEPPKSNA